MRPERANPPISSLAIQNAIDIGSKAQTPADGIRVAMQARTKAKTRSMRPTFCMTFSLDPPQAGLRVNSTSSNKFHGGALMCRILLALLATAAIYPATVAAQQPATTGQVPCPTGMPQCVWVAMPPQALSWLIGTTPPPGQGQPTSKDSILDLAAKSIGADGSAVIAQVLLYLRAAQPGTPPAAAGQGSPVEGGK